jgi:hypothetical protein
MARSHPGQLSLFDDLSPPGLLAGSAMPAEPAPVEADQLLLALLAGGKSAGAILGLAESLAARHGLTDHLLVADLFHVPLLHLGAADDLDDAELARIVGCGAAVEMRRFSIHLGDVESQIGTEGLHPIRVGLKGTDEVDMLADLLHRGLRERGLVGEPAEGFTLLLGESPSLVPYAPIARPIEVPVREFAVVRHIVSQGLHEVLQKWTLAA